MRAEALFLNGVLEPVLKEILDIQEHLPEQILYLQPHSTERRIAQLAEEPPSVVDRVRLFASVTYDLPKIRYVGEVVGWDDKRKLAGEKLNALNRVIYALQPNEGGVYRYTDDPDRLCVNLLYVRRMRRLSRPFSVAELVVTSSGEPHSTNRSTPGGWSYVFNPEDAWLRQYL